MSPRDEERARDVCWLLQLVVELLWMYSREQSGVSSPCHFVTEPFRACVKHLDLGCTWKELSSKYIWDSIYEAWGLCMAVYIYRDCYYECGSMDIVHIADWTNFTCASFKPYEWPVSVYSHSGAYVATSVDFACIAVSEEIACVTTSVGSALHRYLLSTKNLASLSS